MDLVYYLEEGAHVVENPSQAFKEANPPVDFSYWKDGKWFALISIPNIEEIVPYIQKGILKPDAETEWYFQNIFKQKALLGWETPKKTVEQHHKIADRIKENIQEVGNIPVPLNTKPFSHQVEAFNFAYKLDASALFMEQGTGKTLPTIAVAGWRYNEGQVKRLLIIAPKSVVDVWEEQFEEHAAFPYRIKLLIGDKIEKRKETLLNWKEDDGLQIAVINFEAIWRIDKELLKWKPDMVVIDESQKIKKHTAKQSKVCHKLGPKAKYRMLLSGTPTPKTPLDIFSQYRFLDYTVFGKRWPSFRDKYARRGGFANLDTKVRKNKLKELSRLMYSRAFRVTKKEALDLPGVVDQNRYCYFNDKTQKVYDEMEEHGVISILKGDKITAPIVLTELLKLQQITGGFVTREEEVIKIGTEKLDLLEEVLEGIPKDKKIIVFARFIPEIKAIKKVVKRAGRTVKAFTGKTKNRKKLIQKFQKKDNPQVLVVQIQTGGLGITLTSASYAIFYSANFSYADYEQAKARLDRIGQKEKVTCIHLIVKDTVDEKILQALKEKRDLAELVLDTYLTQMKGGKEMAKKKKGRGRTSVSAGEEENFYLRKLNELKEQIEEEPEDSKEEPQEEKPKKKDKKKSKKKKEGGKENVSTKKNKKKKKEPESNAIFTVKDLAGELGISPVALRKRLREEGLEKPEGGRWEWPEDHPDLEEIRAWNLSEPVQNKKTKVQEKMVDDVEEVEEDEEDEDEEEDEEEMEEDDEEEELDYEELKVKELKQLCKERALKVPKKAKKPQLVELLMDYDNKQDDEYEEE